jgi:hypothetical protein
MHFHFKDQDLCFRLNYVRREQGLLGHLEPLQIRYQMTILNEGFLEVVLKIRILTFAYSCMDRHYKLRVLSV